MSKKEPSSPMNEIDEDILRSFYDISLNDIDTKDINPIYHEISQVEERYSEHEFIAEGAVKRVYKAKDNHLGISVALAHPKDHKDKSSYESFLEEARITALLKHPNIITIHDIGLNKEGVPYFTMEFRDSQNLEDYLEKQKKSAYHNSPEERYSILLQLFLKICDAIAFAHDQNVIHLDLKPKNIQVGEFGDVFICDWGIGKILDYEAQSAIASNFDELNNHTMMGHFRGSPGYIAPEQMDQRPKGYPADVYGLGYILYTMMTGTPPFEGTIEEQLQSAKSGTFSPPSKIPGNEKLPVNLEKIILKAMSLKPEDRYPSAKELRYAILDYTRFLPDPVEDNHPATQFKLIYKKRKFAFWVFTTSLFLNALFLSMLLKK